MRLFGAAIFVLCCFKFDGYVQDRKVAMTSVDAQAILPPRTHGEVLVAWPVLVDQFDKSKPTCRSLLAAANAVSASWLSYTLVPDNVWDTVLLDFKTKARRAGCLVLDKGETY